MPIPPESAPEPRGTAGTTWLFLALSFAWSWSVAFAAWMTGGLATSVRHVLFGFAFMLGPALAALVVTRGLRGAERNRVLGFRRPFDRWLLIAWLLPALLIGLSILGSGWFSGVEIRSPRQGLLEQMAALATAKDLGELQQFPALPLSVLLVFQAVVVGTLLNAPLMLSEELGWRGYLWSRWEPLGFWRNAMATGVVWGFWHAPIILMGHNYPDRPVSGVFLMVVFCTLLAPTLHFVRARGGTVWHACVFHGAINAVATLAALCIEAPSWVGRGILGVPGFLVLATSALIVARLRATADQAGQS